MKELTFNKLTRKDSLIKEYDLVQYTPHLHFQADEKGACLRASEVKPKLDRFIWEYVNRNNDRKIEDKWILKNKESQDTKTKEMDYLPALDYKVSIRIKPGSVMEKLSIPQFSSYFGATGKNDDSEKKNEVSCVFYDKGLKLTIISQHKELLKLIDYVLPAFFELTCFGTRSTKGWGSYGICNKAVNLELLNEFVDCYYDIKIIEAMGKTKGHGFPALEQIKVLSNMMKAGINHKGYYKGRIFRYYTENGVGSDKAFMKQKIKGLEGQLDDDDRSESRKEYKSFIYSRGILGLAPSYQFRKSNRIPGHGTKREGTVLVSDGDDKKGSEKGVERFNNPIHFIVRKDKIIILPTKIPDELSGRTMVFEKVKTDGKGNVIKNKKTKKPVVEYTKEIQLPTLKPSKAFPGDKEFNLIEFLDYFREQFNSRKDMEKKGQNEEGPPSDVLRFKEQGVKIQKYEGANHV